MLVRADGRTLLVRKRHTTAFMQPGGKIDCDETAQRALVRELQEELGIRPTFMRWCRSGSFRLRPSMKPASRSTLRCSWSNTIKPCSRRLKSRRRSGSSRTPRVIFRLHRSRKTMSCPCTGSSVETTPIVPVEFAGASERPLCRQSAMTNIVAEAPCEDI
jgi:8-oxo-dGTP pyrophosphatase MutT (NUDIX family)